MPKWELTNVTKCKCKFTSQFLLSFISTFDPIKLWFAQHLRNWNHERLFEMCGYNQPGTTWDKSRKPTSFEPDTSARSKHDRTVAKMFSEPFASKCSCLGVKLPCRLDLEVLKNWCAPCHRAYMSTCVHLLGCSSPLTA